MSLPKLYLSLFKHKAYLKHNLSRQCIFYEYTHFNISVCNIYNVCLIQRMYLFECLCLV